MSSLDMRFSELFVRAKSGVLLVGSVDTEHGRRLDNELAQDLRSSNRFRHSMSWAIVAALTVENGLIS
jgi:hypothetical protein